MVKINPRCQSQPTSSPEPAGITQGKGKWALPFMRKVKRLHPFNDDEVRAKAHQLWLKRGGGEGEEKKDWERAIKALKWERSPLGRTFRVLGTPVRAIKFVQFAFKADSPKEALDVVKTVISALGLIATAGAVIGLVINYQQGQERLVTDRFAKAVEQLGSQEINVRIGAIYSLERIAKDSPKDHWTVMEVLTAYVRERSSVPVEWIDAPLDRRKELPKVTTDLQSVLTVIGRRKLENDPKWPHVNLANTNITSAYLNRADLSNVNLGEANLYKTNLSDVNLIDANLYKANLSDADLTKANLERANLNESNIERANLNETRFIGAKLSSANLRKAYLRDADLTYANLTYANLTNANLWGANLFRANLRSAALVNTYLIGTSLHQAKLRDANLENADLTGADFSDADLTSADIRGANLAGANLSNASLWNADLRGARGWTDAQLSQAYLCETKLPEGSKLDSDQNCR